ncbi:allurin-like isoform X2 [Rhinoderma darwinii]|uniref:allurin-like isoform X2 n=1 Tax=Rhinoderma darwinii TaxID=43563 RepID=UPI003F66C204
MLFVARNGPLSIKIMGPKKTRYLDEDNFRIALTESDKRTIVNTHNTIRRNVNPPAADMQKMVWNEEVAANAENVAALCSLQHSHVSNRFIYKPSLCSCGENLYVSSSESSWNTIIHKWAKEKEDFTYGKGNDGYSTGHYTQVVWAESTQIGCGAAKCDTSGYQFPIYLMVCHYCPAGNENKKMATPYESGAWCSKCNGACENHLCV